MEKEIVDLKFEFKSTFEILKEYKSDQLEEIFDIWYKVYTQKVRIYSTLSDHFFNINPLVMNEADENVNIFLRNINLLKKVAIRRGIDEGFNDFIEKITDHIELIGIQVNRMDSGVKEIDQIKEKLTEDIAVLKLEFETKKEEFDDLSRRTTKLNDKQDAAVKKAKKVQKEFVTILGIFATILITTFGGLTSLASIFNNINNAGTGKLILLGSFVIFTVMLIVFLLLNGISKLSELNIRSCGCKVNSPCNCPISKKHPTLYLVTVMLIMTSLLGLSEYLIDYNLLFTGVEDWTLVLFLGVIIFLVPVLAFINFNDANNRKV